MPLSAAARLAPHFTAQELGADKPEATGEIVANLRLVAEWLEIVRGILGVPLRVTSGFRTAAQNAAVGGSSRSDHLRGLAADFVPVGLSQFAAWQILRSTPLPAFDQIEFEVADGHIHVGLGPKRRLQFLIQVTEGSFLALTETLAQKLRGAPVASLAFLVVASALLYLLLIGLPRGFLT